MLNDTNQIFQLHELLRLLNLDLNRLKVEMDGGTSLGYDFDIQANEFIKFAELDLGQDTAHGLVNALSNAKRAIDCQVDTFLGCFGLLSRRSFPKKMDLLHEMGRITPRIVNKVINARNYLEHEFKKPNREQVEDTVDIATLFVISLEQELHLFNTDFSFKTIVDGVFDEGHRFADKWLSINYDYNEMNFSLSGIIFDEIPTPESRKAHTVGISMIRPKEIGFIELVKIAINLNKSFHEKDLSLQAIQFINLFNMRKE